MSSLRRRGEAKKLPFGTSRALLASASVALALLASWWFYPAQETLVRAREQAAGQHERAASRAASLAMPSEAESNAPNERHASRIDRAAFLRAITPQRAMAAAAGVPEETRAPAPALGREYVANGIRNAIPLLRECYDALLEHRPDAAGTVQISATIDAEPEVGAVVSESEVSGRDELANDAEFTRCLRETMRTIELEPPDRAGRATFSFPLRFAAHPSSDAGSQ